MEPSRSPAQVAALVLGAWWAVNGVGAFLLDPNFATGRVHGGGTLLGLVAITANGWHALFHLIPGLIGVAVWNRPRASLAYVFATGTLYVGVGVWALFAGGDAFGPIAVDGSGDVVHIAEGAVALAAGLLTLRVGRPAYSARSCIGTYSSSRGPV